MNRLLTLANDIRRVRSDPGEYAKRIEQFCMAARLDDAVLAHASTGSNNARPVAVNRKPVDLGMGSIWLSEVTVSMSAGSRLILMEKAMDAANPEALFWTSASAGFQLAGQRYTSVAPLFSIVAGPLTILYFPYFDHIHRSKLKSKENFRAHIDVLVRAVAEFNTANYISAKRASSAPRRIRLVRKVTPSIEQIQTELGLKSAHASRLLQNACQSIDARWDELQEMYEAVPVCLSHNDIGPGNAIVDNDHVYLLDFEKAAPAPLGSDMHTILRWGGDSLLDEQKAERLLAVYADEVGRVRPGVTLEHVRVGAWVTFFMRYSSIAKWASARNLDSFSLALLKARELLGAGP